MTCSFKYSRQKTLVSALSVFACVGMPAHAQDYVPMYSVWSDVGVTYSNRNSSVAGFRGAQTAISAGVDTQVGDTGVLGMFGSLENSLYDTTDASGSGQSWSNGAGVGLYAGNFFFDSIFANATVHYQHLQNHFTLPGTSASYITRALNGSLTATGYYQFDYFRLSPSGTVSVGREWQDGYTETSGAVSPARVTDTVSVDAGLEAGYTFFIDDTRTIEPWVSAGFDWQALERATPAPAPNLDPVNRFDVHLGAGLNAGISEGISLGVRGGVSGLTTPRYLVVSAGGQLSGRF